MMKITNLSQIQTNPLYILNKNNEKKDEHANSSENYEFTKNIKDSSLLWNYTQNEIGKTSRIKNVSLGLNSLYTPNWNVIPTKGMKVSSKDELLKQIKEVATRTAIAAKSALRNVDESTAINLQIEKLLAQYISPVSPDRKTLHQQAMNAIKKHKPGNKMIPLGDPSLVDYLNKMDNITTETNKSLSLSGGGSMSSTMNSLGGYDYEVTQGGHTLLQSVNGKWHYGLTPEESLKKNEFYQIYWSFVDEAKKELNE